jgi:hypothetical protein
LYRNRYLIFLNMGRVATINLHQFSERHFGGYGHSQFIDRA